MAVKVAAASEPHIFVILGDAMLFVRDDWVEASWDLYTPLVANKPKVAPYAAGSWDQRKRTRC